MVWPKNDNATIHNNRFLAQGSAIKPVEKISTNGKFNIFSCLVIVPIIIILEFVKHHFKYNYQFCLQSWVIELNFDDFILLGGIVFVAIVHVSFTKENEYTRQFSLKHYPLDYVTGS